MQIILSTITGLIAGIDKIAENQDSLDAKTKELDQ